jgi:Photoprotection regulator fluorescence recovery protein
MIAQISEPPDIWSIHDFLSHERKRTDEIFDYRYSVLIEVFGILLREGWLSKRALTGLSPDKIAKIERMARS